MPPPNAHRWPHKIHLESSNLASEHPTVGHFGQNSGHKSFDFSACGGWNDGGQAFCAPGVQNREQEVVPQQLDVRMNYESMGLDQAIAVPVPQVSFPLTAPTERTPDNGTIT